jgi:hypothetical protein
VLIWCNVAGFFLLVDFDGPLSPFRLWSGMILLWSLGSSLAQIVILSLFSKHLQANPTTRKAQGVWMGWITAAGSIGRIIFPFATGMVVDSITRGGVFFAVALVQAALLVGSLAMSTAMKEVK